ncbi:MAG TPA: hypothetical protein PKA64_15185 [Myxococcota bacterium]|nr:hypothetical protein [Myxococcota bacterium]
MWLLLLACHADLSIRGKEDPPVEVETDAPADDTDGAVVPVDVDLPTPSAVAEDGGPVDEWFELDDDLQWPESFAWDPQTEAFYVSSLWYGDVRRVGADGRESVFFQDERSVDADPQPWQTWGVEVDVDRRRLFACASWNGGGPVTWFVWILDLDTGERLSQIEMARSSPGAQCRDFAVGADGKVYVTDRAHPVVHVIDPVAEEVSVFADDPALDTTVWGPDGVALTPDGRGLLVGLSRAPGFVFVPLLHPEAPVRVQVEGDDWQMGGGQGIDGLAFVGDDVYVAAVNRLLRVHPVDPSWELAELRSYEAPIHGMSAVTVAGDRLFALNGDPNAWTLGIRPDLPFKIYRVDAAAYP